MAVFADNAGGSQVLEGVVKQMGEYMLGSNVQMGEQADEVNESSPTLIATRRTPTLQPTIPLPAEQKSSSQTGRPRRLSLLGRNQRTSCLERA